jgi:protease I
MKKLEGLTIALLVADGFEQSEMQKPRLALDLEGAITKIVSPKKAKVRGWSQGNWADEFPVDVHLFAAKADDYDALLLPGGVLNPDQLRMIPQAVDFVKAFVDAKKPIAAICHGPWTLINAGAVKGKMMTSWPSIKIDLINAGARWEDKEVVRDGILVTSRKPDDIPSFNKVMIELFAEKLKN